MPLFIITLPPMAADETKSACAGVLGAATGDLTMQWAYVDTATNQPLCCWSAPDRRAIEDLFRRAGQETESVRGVRVFKAPA